jgi:hypothetical protein
MLLEVAPRVVDRSEAALGFLPRNVRRESFAHELLGAHVDVRADFFVDIARDDIAPANAEAKESPDAGTDHSARLVSPAWVRR